MTKFLTACIFLLLPFAAHAENTATPVDRIAVANRIIGQFLQPQSEAFRLAAAAQNKAWQEACADDKAVAGIAPLEVAFTATVKAYASLEIIRTGPLSEKDRYERLAHWPERRNAITKGIKEILGETDALTPDVMRGRSTAIQGLSALERLIYDEPLRAALKSSDGKPARACAVGVAVAGSVLGVAEEIATIWADPAGAYRVSIKEDAGARAMLASVTTDLLSTLQMFRDKKIALPIGASPGEERPVMFEWRRSRQTIPAIIANLGAAEHLAGLLLDTDAATGHAYFPSAIRTATQLLEAKTEDLAVAKRSQMILLKDLIDTALMELTHAVPIRLAVVVGFSSLDGD